MLWRFPFAGAPESAPPMPLAAQDEFPGLRDRFTTLDEILVPEFATCDREAGEAQAAHRRYQLLIIVGSLLTTAFGAVQAAWTDVWWPGVAVGVLGALTAAVANQQRRSRPIRRYLAARAKTEHLRSLYFRYLSGIDAGLTERGLERAVATIVFDHGAEATG